MRDDFRRLGRVLAAWHGRQWRLGWRNYVATMCVAVPLTPFACLAGFYVGAAWCLWHAAEGLYHAWCGHCVNGPGCGCGRPRRGT